MALYSASGHAEVLAAIAAENTFEYPLTLDNTTITKVVVDSKDPSKARVTVDGVYDSGMRGFTSVNINRIDVAKLVNGVSTIIKSNSDDARKVSDILPAIADQLGIDLPVEWIVDADLVLNDSVGDKPLYGAKFTVAPNHPILYGSFDFNVDGIILDINRLITNIEVNGLVDNSPHTAGKICPTAITYGNDYSAAFDAFKKVPIVTTTEILLEGANSWIAKELAMALNAVDGNPWVYSTTKGSRFNLYGTKIRRHCNVSAYNLDLGCNTDYDNILVLRPHGMWCGDLASDGLWGFFIHYDNVMGVE